MKKIEDYIHFYLGCPCQYLMMGRGIISEVSIDSKYGILVSVKLDGSIKHIQCPLSDIKLILRPLISVTDIEWEKIEYDILIAEGTGYDMIKNHFIIGTIKYRMGWKCSNESLVRLRKIGIDVDGLIEAGLAINSTTLK